MLNFLLFSRGRKRLFLYGKYSRFVKCVDMDTYRMYAYANVNQFDGRVQSYFNLSKKASATPDMSKYKKSVQPRTKDFQHPVHIQNSEWMWVHSKLPPYRDQYYNFTYYAMTLNEIEPYMLIPGVLCPTDSRFRPDVRHYEEGRVDAAELAKTKLEDAQRQRAKLRTTPWQPRWFEKAVSPLTGEEYWKFGGEYWKRDFSKEGGRIFQIK